MRRSKGLIINAILVFLIFLAGIAGLFIGKNAARGAAVKQFILTGNVKRGHSIEGHYQEVNRSKNDSLDESVLIVNENDLKGKIASYDLYENDPITVTNICNKDELERNLDFSMPTTVEGSIANSLEKEDIVAIKVKYKDNKPDDCVVPSIPITGIKTSNGAELKADGSEVPGFLLFHVTDQESTDLNAASKEGTLYVVRYRDLSQPRLKKTYSTGSSKSSSNEATGENSDKPADSNSTNSTN